MVEQLRFGWSPTRIFDQPLSKSSPSSELLKTHYHIVIIYLWQYDDMGDASYDELAQFDIWKKKFHLMWRGRVSWVSCKAAGKSLGLKLFTRIKMPLFLPSCDTDQIYRQNIFISFQIWAHRQNIFISFQTWAHRNIPLLMFFLIMIKIKDWWISLFENLYEFCLQ